MIKGQGEQAYCKAHPLGAEGLTSADILPYSLTNWQLLLPSHPVKLTTTACQSLRTNRLHQLYVCHLVNFSAPNSLTDYFSILPLYILLERLALYCKVSVSLYKSILHLVLGVSAVFQLDGRQHQACHLALNVILGPLDTG